jgi:hypothetical protein
MTTRATLRHLRRQLSRLEGDSCGPGCPPVYCPDDDWYGQPVEPVTPLPCPRCGREPIILTVAQDVNFYGNADRLAARDLS